MYKITLPLRYLVRRRITYLAVLAVALSVFIACVVLTVMHGLVEGFKVKNHRFVGDCVVGSSSVVGFAYYEDLIAKLESEPYVEAVSPMVRSFGLFTFERTDHSDGVEIFGIDPVCHSRVTGFAQSLHYRVDEPTSAFTPIYDPNLTGCVFGIDRIFRKNDDGQYSFFPSTPTYTFDITCFPLTAKGTPKRAGLGEVSTKRFYLSDVSCSGLARIDDHVAYLPLADAQYLSGMSGMDKRISAVHIKFKEGVLLEEGTTRVQALWEQFRLAKADAPLAYLMETVTVMNWRHFRRASIAAIEKEETALIIMFTLVGITTVFIVLVVFYMIVNNKRKDIGILRSVGVSRAGIIGLFGTFAALVGLCGALIGLVGAWQFLARINALEDWLNDRTGFQVWDRSMFAIGDIPNEMDPTMVCAIAGSALIACLLGACIPTWQAARLRPIETLQVNQL